MTQKFTFVKRTVCGILFTVTGIPSVKRKEGLTFTMSDLLRVEQTIAVRLAILGIATGESFKYMRKTVGMRANEIAGLIGIRAETISRWESGGLPVNRSAWCWLAVLVAENSGFRMSALTPMLSASMRKSVPPKTVTTELLKPYCFKMSLDPDVSRWLANQSTKHTSRGIQK